VGAGPLVIAPAIKLEYQQMALAPFGPPLKFNQLATTETRYGRT
jgi:hypothetical protein